MNYTQAVRGRAVVGRIGALVCILLFVALLDSCVSRFREPLFTVKLLPGAVEAVDGQLDPSVREISQLRTESSSTAAVLSIKELRTGFWFGGNMWIGAIAAAPDALPGTYDIRVYSPIDKPGVPGAAFKAIVFKDGEALLRSSLSYIQRTFNIRPWIVSLACVPMLATVLGIVYLLSSRIERLLAMEGRAEIFQLQKTDTGTEIWFGLGHVHGVSPGVRVLVCDGKEHELGDAVVQRVDDENAIALTDIPETRLQKGVVKLTGASAPRTQGR